MYLQAVQRVHKSSTVTYRVGDSRCEKANLRRIMQDPVIVIYVRHLTEAWHLSAQRPSGMNNFEKH